MFLEIGPAEACAIHHGDDGACDLGDVHGGDVARDLLGEIMKDGEH